MNGLVSFKGCKHIRVVEKTSMILFNSIITWKLHCGQKRKVKGKNMEIAYFETIYGTLIWIIREMNVFLSTFKKTHIMKNN